MDASIMKLLDDDEDETIHSGADVDAFTAELNRDIKGEPSSLPLDSDSGKMSEGRSSDLLAQWENSIRENTITGQNQQRRPNELQQQQSSYSLEQNQLQRQKEQNTPAISQIDPFQTCEQSTDRIPERNRMQIPDNQHLNQEVQNINNQQAHAPNPSSEQSSNPMGRNQIPFALLIPAMQPHLDKDKSMQLNTLFTKLRANGIDKNEFTRHMRAIVGDNVLKQVLQTVQRKMVLVARKSQAGPNQFQKNDRVPTDPSQVPNTTVQLQTSSVLSTTINPEMEHSATQLRGFSNQQQQAFLPQTSFPNYGANVSNYHPYTGPPVSSGLSSVHPEARDSHLRQVPFNHRMGSTQSGGTYQPTSATRASATNLTGPWQSSMNKDKQVDALLSTAGVKQEMVDQIQEKQQKSQVSAISARQLNEINSASPRTLKDEAMDKLSSRNPFSNSTPQTNSTLVPKTTQMDPMMAGPSATAPLGVGANAKTLLKKPLIGQKKPLDALGTSSPGASKKQKVTGGGFLDQSIEQLNDVTAVSGVNIREEEEQLLSGPKEENRASEASRRVVQEEEERLILQKAPLQRKLAKTMSKFGMKNISKDVERCLSLCVEERMRGLINNLIRLSKQRVDIERQRHRTIITSDVRRQILLMNRKAKEDWEKKQAEDAENLRKLNKAEGTDVADGDKDKDDGCPKAPKANKEEDDKMRTTAANVAARVAVGGDDMLTKWTLMAEQARQKREGGQDIVSTAQSVKDFSPKSLLTSGRMSKSDEGAGNRSSIAASGAMRKSGKGSVMSQMKIARSISTKDVIAALEREPQMSKSTLIYRLYNRTCSDTVAEQVGEEMHVEKGSSKQ